jgi:hypothetical protein
MVLGLMTSQGNCATKMHRAHLQKEVVCMIRGSISRKEACSQPAPAGINSFYITGQLICEMYQLSKEEQVCSSWSAD